ncbi:13032_t:CDS:2 [Cetraspora pellucida]|uniref:13032_t:CDS:1 n=1 Tax=Cetraspora pellucida TaxID=1433469 RepID=A0ACA9LGS8_9GLOM|nr:13032_t:CDS:2 [Cetraspora pellucida]
MSTFTNATICLDSWTNVSKNSIYGFIVLKEHQKHIIDIIDLFAESHRESFIKDQTIDILTRNRFQMSYAIACVTDNPTIMVSMKNLLEQFVMKVLAIVLHEALEQIKNELQKAIPTKKKNEGQKFSDSSLVKKNVDVLFEEEDKIEEQNEINEELSIVNIEYEETSIIDKFFDFDAYERDQKAFLLEETCNNSVSQNDEDWSIEDILIQYR